MNKLLTNINGGFPFVLDDLRFNDAAYRDAFKAVMKAFDINGTDRFIIAGCEVTSNLTTHNIAPGWIYYDGEIYAVDAQSIQIQVGPGAGYYFEPIITYDPAGNKTFEDGTQHDTYEVRKAKVYFGTLPTNALLMISPRLIDLTAQYTANHLIDYLEDVNIVGAQGQPSFAPGWSSSSNDEPVGFYKDLQSNVILQGFCGRNFYLSNVIFQLPNGYRPLKLRRFTSYGEDTTGTAVTISVFILTNGNVQVDNLDNNNPVKTASLEGVRFRI